MDALDAILASMAAKTGNVLPPPAAPTTTTTTEGPLPTAPGPKTTSATTTKRPREPPAASMGIWNPTAPVAALPAPLLADVAARAARLPNSPPTEIARQQVVRQLCQRIKRAAEELGIPRLPNAAYETWQFTSRLTVAEVDPLIPHAGSDYAGLLEELVKAGAPRAGAKAKCRELTKEAERQLRRFQQQQRNGDTGAKKRVRVSRGDDGMVALTYGHTTVRVSAAHFDKLRCLYARWRAPTETREHQRAFEAAAFSLLLRYDSLDGGGFQAALNEECFDVLLERFDCRMECFASPLNSRYARFCSAFLDTDAPFGSMGSFFEFSPRAGCFEANPPFIPKLIKRMADHMSALLDAADGALMFIIIIPAWKETEGWQLLHTSRYNQQHLLIPQKDHGYCEGKQQIRKTRWRIASFDTSVFFWQNPKAINQWPVTSQALEALRSAFRSKQADEREAMGLRNSGKRVRSSVKA